MWIYQAVGALAGWIAGRLWYGLTWERYRSRTRPATPEQIEKVTEDLMCPAFHDATWRVLFTFGLFALWVGLSAAIGAHLVGTGLFSHEDALVVGLLLSAATCTALYRLVYRYVRCRVRRYVVNHLTPKGR